MLYDISDKPEPFCQPETAHEADGAAHTFYHQKGNGNIDPDMIKQLEKLDLIDEIENILMTCSEHTVNYCFSAEEYMFHGRKLVFHLLEFINHMIGLKKDSKYARGFALLQNDTEYLNRMQRLVKSVLYVYAVQDYPSGDRRTLCATAELASIEAVHFIVDENRYLYECKLWKIDAGLLVSRCLLSILNSN